MRRRSFLGMLAATAAAGWPAQATAQRHAIVIGGGPAGLSAALVLAERGIRVTLVEASDGLGGKARGTGDRQRRDGPSATVHGCWPSYAHLRQLLDRYNLLHVLEDAPASPPTLRLPGIDVHGADLRNKLQLARRFIERAHLLGHPVPTLAAQKGRRFLESLSPARAWKDLSGLSVADWQNHGAPLTFFGAFSEEMSQAHWSTRPGDLDAATFALGERFFSGAGTVRWLAGDLQGQIWSPLGRRLQDLGGDVRLGKPADSLVFRRGRIQGVRVGVQLPGVSLEEHPGDWIEVERLEHPSIFVGTVGPNQLIGLSGRCTHCGGELLRDESELSCPADGARFNLNGQPVAGPARFPLRRVKVEQGDDGLYVDGEDLRETLLADAVVLAVPVQGLQHLAAHLLPATDGLKSGDVPIARFRMDRDVSIDSQPAATFVGLPHVTKGFLLHRLDPTAREWAQENGGSVIEVHTLGSVAKGMDHHKVMDLLVDDVRRAWPELEDAKVLERSLTFGHDLTTYSPGWQKHAATVNPGIPGLRICGDHVAIDTPSQGIERAVLSGRLAANDLLEEWGLPTAPILGG